MLVRRPLLRPLSLGREPPRRPLYRASTKPPPGSRVGPIGEKALDSRHDFANLVMSKRPDENAASVRAAALCPLANDRHEVAAVSGHQDPPLRSSELDHPAIIQPFQRRMLPQAEDIVPCIPQRHTHTGRRKVRVQQEPHPLSSGRWRRAVVLQHLGDLPHIETRADDPRAPPRIVPLKAMPGNRRMRAASWVSASTMALFDRRVRRASASTRRSVASESRMLNGSPFAGPARATWPRYDTKRTS